MWQTVIPADACLLDYLEPSWVVIDCRFYLDKPDKGEQAYRKSHLFGAHYAHLDRDLSGPVIPGKTGRHPLPRVSSFVRKVESWGVRKRSQIVVYDQNEGKIAARLWWMFNWIGHKKVAVLNGGWKEWTRREYPVTNALPDAVKPVKYNYDLKKDLVVNRSKVDKIRRNHAWTLVDARDADRYSGKREPIDPVAGHIDGAVNHPWMLNVDDDGLWRSGEKLRRSIEMSAGSIDPDHTVFYCGSGVTACHNVLACKEAGYGEVKLYPGSWSEWITKVQ